MSKFYTEIATYYDYIFPTGMAQLELIKEVAGKPPKKILDVACGSGGYSEKLSNEGYQVTAIDLDEQMVNNLQKKNPKVDAHVLNMLHIEDLNKKFDLIFCIGNSIVHLNNNEEIHRYLESCKHCLHPKGKIVLQIVNFDRVLAEDVRELPEIKNDAVNLTFKRYYEYIADQHKIKFKTVLTVNDKQWDNSVLLHPIHSQELLKLLEGLGYTNIQFYGSFKKDAFDSQESFPLIVVAEM